MKNFKVISILALTLLLLTGGVGNTAHAYTLRFVNYSGKTIYYLYARPSDLSDWGSDLLGSSTLPHSYWIDITLPNNYKYYDIRAVWKSGSYSDGDNYWWGGIDIVNVGRVRVSGVRKLTHDERGSY